MYAKIITASLAIATTAVLAYSYSSFGQNENANGIEIARSRALEAQKKLHEAIDARSRSIWSECFEKATSQSGEKFETQQRQAYECWKNGTSEITKTNGTAELTPASEPPSYTTITRNSQKDGMSKSTIGSGTGKVSTRSNQVVRTKKSNINPVEKVSKSNSGVVKSTNSTYAGGKTPQTKEAKYWMAYETAIDLIRKFEGYAPVAKWDVKQCSGGFGHKAPCGMKVSKAQADKWLASDTHSWLSQVIADFPTLSPQAQGALASFRHNCPAGYNAVRTRGLSAFHSWCKVSKDPTGKVVEKYTRGLTKRRAEEAFFIFK